jgi:GTP-binding protein HflX
LLNALTRSDVYTEDRLFATLDPATRRIRLGERDEALVTDTVGFIRDLPPDLIAAFRATLEELQDSVLLVHVIDSASDQCERQLAVVEDLLASLDLGDVPLLRVFNKADMAPQEQVRNLCRRYQGIPVSALHTASLPPLLTRVEALLAPGEQDAPRPEISINTSDHMGKNTYRRTNRSATT